MVTICYYEFGCFVRLSLGPSWKNRSRIDFTFRQTWGHFPCRRPPPSAEVRFRFWHWHGGCSGHQEIALQSGTGRGNVGGSSAEFSRIGWNWPELVCIWDELGWAKIYDTLWYHVCEKVRSVCQLFWRWSINISILIGHFIHEFGWKLNHIEKLCWNGRVGCNGTHWTVRVAMEINQFAEHHRMCVSPEPSSSGWIVLCTSSDPQE